MKRVSVDLPRYRILLAFVCMAGTPYQLGAQSPAPDIVADVIARMSRPMTVVHLPTVGDWATAFDRYGAAAARAIPQDLLNDARRVYSTLAGAQKRPRLLHGDLHHSNILFDTERGWLAVDPKGVIGEVEYEVGAMLRNPLERPQSFLEPSRVDRRLHRLAQRLTLDVRRALAWGFAQAVLGIVWAVEDGLAVGPTHPWLILASMLRDMAGESLGS